MARRTQSGVTTSDVVMSSYHSDNSEIFPLILDLHVPPGAKIADITYSSGVFWRNVDLANYNLLATDIKTGVDCRHLPYEADSIDCVVFDPPYMEGFYRREESHLAGEGSHSAFRKYYSDGSASEHSELKYHDRVVDMYMTTAIEVYRVLTNGGVFIVKCQDEVSANRQKLTHVEIIFGYERLGYYCRDIFVVTRRNKPVISKLVKQVHARKNHSYFLVFSKEKGKPRYINCSDLVASYSAPK
jgi:tRNA G10  N-methylase Trm11